jgi:hypothetical protein
MGRCRGSPWHPPAPHPAPSGGAIFGWRWFLVQSPCNSVLRGSARLHFHLINPKTGHRIRMLTVDAETDEEVTRNELVKGYEFEKDQYLLLEDEDFE